MNRYVVEDECFVDDGLRPFPPLDQDGLASTPPPPKTSPALAASALSRHRTRATYPIMIESYSANLSKSLGYGGVGTNC